VLTQQNVYSINVTARACIFVERAITMPKSAG
jgi:hypothetical protein